MLVEKFFFIDVCKINGGELGSLVFLWSKYCFYWMYLVKEVGFYFGGKVGREIWEL